MEETLKYKYHNGEREVFPQHSFVNNWIFTEDSEDEAHLALYIAKVAEKNGMSINDVYAVFPFILRMLKSKNIWAGSERPFVNWFKLCDLLLPTGLITTVQKEILKDEIYTFFEEEYNKKL